MKSDFKSIFSVFSDIRGVAHREFVLRGQTINAQFYCSVTRLFGEDIRRRRLQLWQEGNWMLPHGNAPAHRALETRQFLDHTGTAILPQPPYSPDSDPCDFFLFSKTNLELKGSRFETLTEIRSDAGGDTLQGQVFQGAFQEWKKRGVSPHKGTASGEMLVKVT